MLKGETLGNLFLKHENKYKLNLKETSCIRRDRNYITEMLRKKKQEMKTEVSKKEKGESVPIVQSDSNNFMLF